MVSGRYKRPGTVYMVGSDLDDAILKVGFTTNLQGRLKALQTGHPHRLNLLNKIIYPDYQNGLRVEAWFKALLSPWPCSGGKDWYRPPEYLRKWTVCCDRRQLQITLCLVDALHEQKAHPTNDVDAEDVCGILASWFDMIGQRSADRRALTVGFAAP